MSRCVAHRQDGEPCRAHAIHGGTVCRVHGGSAPQVKRKAAERLAEVRDAAITKLLEYIQGGKVDEKVALEAALKLTQLVEVLEGRVSNREESFTTDQLDREIARLERELAMETSE